MHGGARANSGPKKVYRVWVGHNDPVENSNFIFDHRHKRDALLLASFATRLGFASVVKHGHPDQTDIAMWTLVKTEEIGNATKTQ